MITKTHHESIGLAVGNIEELHYLLARPIRAQGATAEPAQFGNGYGEHLRLLDSQDLLLVGLLLLLLGLLGPWSLVLVADHVTLDTGLGALLLLLVLVPLRLATNGKESQKDDGQEH